jgi:hypothetical protein
MFDLTRKLCSDCAPGRNVLRCVPFLKSCDFQGGEVHEGFEGLSFLCCTQCQDLRFSACVPVSQLVGVGRAPALIHSAVSSCAVTGVPLLWFGRGWCMVQSRDENEQEAKQEHSAPSGEDKISEDRN